MVEVVGKDQDALACQEGQRQIQVSGKTIPVRQRIGWTTMVQARRLCARFVDWLRGHNISWPCGSNRIWRQRCSVEMDRNHYSLRTEGRYKPAGLGRQRLHMIGW